MADLSDELVATLRVQFDAFVIAGAEGVRTSELKQLLASVGHAVSEKESNQFVRQYSLDPRGVFNFPEFLRMVSDRCRLDASHEEMREIFSIFDKDGNGSISSVELRHVMSNLGERLTDDEVEEMIREADTDGDGEIDFEEFVKMVSRQK